MAVPQFLGHGIAFHAFADLLVDLTQAQSAGALELVWIVLWHGGVLEVNQPLMLHF